ncbi:hypothetical protein SPLC1_S270560 [Arthrospira platensis C1]|nr:hypothetical protein SPLC1_S270560 [Arthrospira platensis C1]
MFLMAALAPAYFFPAAAWSDIPAPTCFLVRFSRTNFGDHLPSAQPKSCNNDFKSDSRTVAGDSASFHQSPLT